ncbi:MAG: hypothetical protein Q7T41_00150 [Candidatus Saccharibacteria bacterium]|nr:hypothetical protein [Candidatus Saccharibacteria bacterium]
MSNIPPVGYESVHLSLNSASVLGLTYTDPEAQLHNDSYKGLAVSCLGFVSIYPNMISFTDLNRKQCDMPIDPVSPSILITTGVVPENSLRITGFTTEGLEPLKGEDGIFGVNGKPFVHEGQEQQWVQYYGTRLQVPFSSGVTLSILTRRNPDAMLVLAKRRQKLKY